MPPRPPASYSIDGAATYLRNTTSCSYRTPTECRAPDACRRRSVCASAMASTSLLGYFGQLGRALLFPMSTNVRPNAVANRMLTVSALRNARFEQQSKAASSEEQTTKKEDSKDAKEEREIALHGYIFDELSEHTAKNKEAFCKALDLFLHGNVRRRGYTEFIYAALKRMKEYGVHKDLDVYKKLIEVFPEGKYVVRNLLQIETMQFIKQQQCCIDVLDEMQWYSVHPDKHLYQLVRARFGEWSHAMRKMKRMVYWMPKFKNANPYSYPRPMPSSIVECAVISMRRMCRDPANVISTWYTEAIPDSTEKTWIVSGQSVHQQEHIAKHSPKKAVYIDGPIRVWVSDESFFHFVLRAPPDEGTAFGPFKSDDAPTAEDWECWETKYTTEFPQSRQEVIQLPTIHEQTDGTILAIAITGTSSKESLVCWMKLLQVTNPKLKEIPVVFRLRHLPGELAVNCKAETSTAAAEGM